MSQDSIVTPPVVSGAGLNAPVLENVSLSLYELFRESVRARQPIIHGRTFRNCRIEGPGVLLALGGVNFDACDLGVAGGDIRNLLFRPVGPKAVGAIPVRDSLFQGCVFFAVGYTGSAAFIDQVIEVLTRSESGAAGR